MIMRRFLEQFNTADPTEESKEREEERQYLQDRIAQLAKELDESRAICHLTISELEDRQKAEVEAAAKALEDVKGQTEQLSDEAEYWKQEIFILQDKAAKAEAANKDLVNSLLQPKDWESITEADGSIEYYRKELVSCRVSESNLKGLIAAKKLLLEDSKREQEDLEGLLRLKHQQLAAVTSEGEQHSQQQELIALRATRDELRLTQPAQTAAPRLAELTLEIDSSQRAIESLLTEKSALVLQLDSLRTAPEDTHVAQGSRIASMKLFRRHRNVRKVMEVVDDLVNEVQTQMDDQSLVKLGLALYMCVLHLLVLFSAFDAHGCPSFMS